MAPFVNLSTRRYASLSCATVLLLVALTAWSLRLSTSSFALNARVSLQSRWAGIPYKRSQALQTQELIWAALGVDASNKEQREYGSSVSGQQIYYLLDAALASSVCEIGFYFGLGAANFLHANDHVVYHGFDVSFNEKLQNLFTSRFGRRAQLHVGSSIETVPAFTGSCDIIHIDGNHHGIFPAADLANMHAKASCDHLVFADDTFDCPNFPDGGQCWTTCDKCDCYAKGVCNEASQAWWSAVKTGLIENFGCVWLGTSNGPIGNYPKGYCVGRYLHVPSCGRANFSATG
jgi:predicted O-methyltransferase YrrM